MTAGARDRKMGSTLCGTIICSNSHKEYSVTGKRLEVLTCWLFVAGMGCVNVQVVEVLFVALSYMYVILPDGSE